MIRGRKAKSAAPLRLLFLTAAAAAALAAPATAAESKLRPESDLTSNCFNFPEVNFDRANSIRGVYETSPHMMLSVGESAIDFTLHDPAGQAWNLREALGLGKPVVLIWGMYTCPAFQGMGTTPPWMKCGYRDEYDLVEENKDRATFVHLYGAEPHPTMPGVNFDSGKMVDQYWSTVSQHQSYQDRLDMVAKIQRWIHPEQVILPDYIPGNPYSDLIQPVWCSYSLGARPALVITPEGTVLFQQEWLQTDHVGHALDVFWESEEESRKEGVARKAPLVDVTGSRLRPNMGGRLGSDGVVDDELP